MNGHLLVPIVSKFGTLNLIEPYGPVQACIGVAIYIGAFRIRDALPQL
jgi:hypothetical protein